MQMTSNLNIITLTTSVSSSIGAGHVVVGVVMVVTTQQLLVKLNPSRNENDHSIFNICVYTYVFLPIIKLNRYVMAPKLL